MRDQDCEAAATRAGFIFRAVLWRTNSPFRLPRFQHVVECFTRPLRGGNTSLRAGPQAPIPPPRIISVRLLFIICPRAVVFIFRPANRPRPSSNGIGPKSRTERSLRRPMDNKPRHILFTREPVFVKQVVTCFALARGLKESRYFQCSDGWCRFNCSGVDLIFSLKQGPIDFVFVSVFWWVHSFARAWHVRGERSGADHRGGSHRERLSAWGACDAVAAPLLVDEPRPLIRIRILSLVYLRFLSLL